VCVVCVRAKVGVVCSYIVIFLHLGYC